MIPQDQIDQAGGDWGQYGELSGQQLLDVIQQGKLSVVFADKGVILGVMRPDGSVGSYNLPHIADMANF